MPSRFTIPVPRDFVLPRDACSYGYFLLEPNHWLPDSAALLRTLALDSGPARITITQPGASPGSPLRAQSDRSLARAERDQARNLVSRMLRLDEDHLVSREFHRADPRWKKSGRCRLFRSPTLFEDVIKTVTSCNVAWPSTIVMNRRLCEVFGSSGSFPTPQVLAAASPATLRERCRVGYRDRRIVEIARAFLTPPSRGGLDTRLLEDPDSPDDLVRDTLLALPGIGPYAAHNIMQLLGRYAHLPLDTESLRHARHVLAFRGTDRAVLKRISRHYAPFASHRFRSYWFELWTHYEQLRGPSWTWERETTGKTFTAAQLTDKPPTHSKTPAPPPRARRAVVVRTQASTPSSPKRTRA